MAEDLHSLFPESLVLPPADESLDTASWPTGGGVYAFLDSEERVLQTIGAQSLKRSIRLRLEPPDEGATKRADLRAITHSIRWQPTASTFETSLVYLSIARVLDPKGYRKQLGFGKCWFARINPDDLFPRWTVDSQIASSPSITVGPFTERRRCNAFVEMLEDVFDLCRKHDILIQAPNGTACAYHEMGKCPAPCDGSISLEQYREMLQDSIRYAVGDRSSLLNELEQRMQEAAQQQAFEQAGRYKTLTERVRKAQNDPSRIAATPDDFRYLIIQRSTGRGLIKAWFVRGGLIRESEPVQYRKLEDHLPHWIRECHDLPASPTIDQMLASEHLWLITHYLSQKERAPGFFLSLPFIAENKDNKALSDMILERFRRSSGTSENISGEDTVNP